VHIGAAGGDPQLRLRASQNPGNLQAVAGDTPAMVCRLGVAEVQGGRQGLERVVVGLFDLLQGGASSNSRAVLTCSG
jgi:hypothetical protein